MPRELISKTTRRAFQEHLVSWTLREINALFQDHDLHPAAVPPDVELPPGERRSLVAQYYYSVNWYDAVQVRRVLAVYETILAGFPAPADMHPEVAENKRSLVAHLKRDGYELVNDSLALSPHFETQMAAVLTATSSIDLAHLEEHTRRITKGIVDDPGLAIGSTKDLLEATLRTILREANLPPENRDDIPSLLKAVQGLLKLAPSEVDDARKGADAVRRVLSGLASCVVGMAELRKHYGTGHGRSRHTGISARHARLAAGAGATVATFLLETWEYQSQRKTSSGA
jgi:Abortive infection C-terminus